MNTYIVNEISTKCAQIREKGVTEEGINQIIRAYKQVLKLCDISRNEGLLELEDSARKIDTDRITDRFLVWMIGLICDGVAPEVVEEYGICKAAALDMHDYYGLILMFYIKAVLWIQAGHSSWGMQNLLLSFWPDFIEEELRNNGII